MHGARHDDKSEQVEMDPKQNNEQTAVRDEQLLGKADRLMLCGPNPGHDVLTAYVVRGRGVERHVLVWLWAQEWFILWLWLQVWRVFLL